MIRVFRVFIAHSPKEVWLSANAVMIDPSCLSQTVVKVSKLATHNKGSVATLEDRNLDEVTSLKPLKMRASLHPASAVLISMRSYL